MTIDTDTKDWIRNAADERAVRNGCVFDGERGEHVINFCETQIFLYEGEHAGQLVTLMPWQRDLFMRLFGWVRFSKDWDRWVRRFRKAGVWIPKKGGKSPTAAMVGTYLLCGDGEQGQKVFSAARDGKQAGIMHTHARMMIEQSPALADECDINRTTGRIFHRPSNSFYEILSGDNIKSQEGINGSIIIDETHVVDERLAKVIEYAGASRSEPLQAEFSTAGDNPQSYGRRQYEYGKAVNAGTVLDEEFFYLCFEAPQDATDEQCCDPETWRLANPSLGYTIKEGELRASCERAKRSLSDFAEFKKYRLNIWQSSANPWLKRDDWSKCRREFTEADLAGRRCIVGLDLSKTRDMTAAVAVFPNDDGESYTILPKFWMPENAARDNSQLASYLEWAQAGYLNLIPGAVMEYRPVKDAIVEWSKKFQVIAVAYDQTYADELTLSLEQEHGIKRTPFPQTVMALAGPTADFERLVIAGRMLHNGHPVLSWQAGHVHCKTDQNNNKRPVKPSQNDHRKIDGIVAGVMALGAVIADPSEAPSVYERPGSLRL